MENNIAKQQFEQLPQAFQQYFREQQNEIRERLQQLADKEQQLERTINSMSTSYPDRPVKGFIPQDGPVLNNRNVSNIKEFFRQFEIHCELLKTPEHEMNLMLALRLQDEPLKVYEIKLHQYDIKPRDYKYLRMKEDLIMNFAHVNKEVSVYEKWDSCRQTGTVHDYYHRLMSLWNERKNLTEEDVIDKFLKGLKPRLQEKVRLQFPTTMDQAFQIAKVFDNQINNILYHNMIRKGALPNQYGPPTMPKEAVTFPTPMEVDNVFLNKLDHQQKQDLRLRNACFKCRQPGHIAPNCPTRKQDYQRPVFGPRNRISLQEYKARREAAKNELLHPV